MNDMVIADNQDANLCVFRMSGSPSGGVPSGNKEGVTRTQSWTDSLRSALALFPYLHSGKGVNK